MILSNRAFGKALIAAAVGLTLTGTPAAAETPQTTSEFDQLVRDALLRNPEIILEVFALLEQKEQAAKAVKDKDLIASVADELFAGLDMSKPILVEFQDYNCGYCRKAHPTVMEMREQIPGLQFVVMEMPILNDGSRYSAQAALALKEIEGEETYVRFVDEMMRNAGPANVATVLKVLTKLGHDAEEIVKAIKEGKGADELNRARDLADALGVTGTPYFVGPGGIIRGVASKDRLQALTVADGSDS